MLPFNGTNIREPKNLRNFCILRELTFANESLETFPRELTFASQENFHLSCGNILSRTQNILFISRELILASLANVTK